MKKVYFLTSGCKVNQYETELLRTNFLSNGFLPATALEEADLVVINTCVVTAKAERDCRNLIYQALRKNKEVIVTGCLVLEGEWLSSEKGKCSVNSFSVIARDKVPKQSDEVVASQPKAGVAISSRLLHFVRNDNKIKFLTKEEILGKFSVRKSKIEKFSGRTRAFVKIEDGCPKDCSYCIVSRIRGPVRRRPEEEILEEICGLANNGYKEIILCGVHLSAYGSARLVELLRKIIKIDKVKRVRLSSIGIEAISDSLIEILSTPKICPHLHISLQSGDDGILKRMNREYSLDEYKELVFKIREKIPKITFSTDIIVGFPGEDKKAFQNSCQAIEEIGFIRTHIFRYSDRKGTPAYSFPDKIPEKLKKERAKELRELSLKVARKEKAKFIGTSLSLLVENRSNGFYSGYTENYIPSLLSSERDIHKGEIIPFLPVSLKEDHLLAIL